MTVVPRADGPSSIIATAFDLLDQVATLEPARLVDLAKATGIPHPTVHRLLGQLIEAGAVRREGTRYRLGASLLELGSRVTPEHRLRVVARRPMAELAAITGAGVGLSASIGGETVFLDTVEPRIPLVVAMPEPGSPVPPRTSSARAHIEIPAPGTDSGCRWCAAKSQLRHGDDPLSGGQVAAMTALITGKRPSVALVAATRAAGAQVARKLRTPSSPRAPIHGKSSLSRQ